jgi:HNH endonuclease
MNKYYVYAHCFSDTKEIFYIGKGSGRRFITKGSSRSNHWHEIVKERDYFAIKIRDNLTEDEAMDFENELLKEFKPVANIVHDNFKVKKVDFNFVNEIVQYDETSPTFLRYKINRANGAIKAGQVAGSFDSAGYGQVYLTDRLYKIHRVIYCLQTKEDLDSNLVIDHIDGNKGNNSISNLRLTTPSENARNIRWDQVKPSNTGERAISLRGNYYRVLWMQDGKQVERSFNFGPRSKSTKEKALTEAISFRDSLIKSGHISIAG